MGKIQKIQISSSCNLNLFCVLYYLYLQAKKKKLQTVNLIERIVKIYH